MQTTQTVWNCQLVDVRFSFHFLSLVKKGMALELVSYVHCFMAIFPDMQMGK
jgi:hypothetical protein